MESTTGLSPKLPGAAVGARRAPAWLGLSGEVWARRHRIVLALLLLHLPVLYGAGVGTGHGALHVLIDVAGVALFTGAAAYRRLGRGINTAAATVGLLGSSALLLHFFEGSTEVFLHSAAVVAILTLYRSWYPFLIAIAFVPVHQVGVGFLERVAGDGHTHAHGDGNAHGDGHAHGHGAPGDAPLVEISSAGQPHSAHGSHRTDDAQPAQRADDLPRTKDARRSHAAHRSHAGHGAHGSHGSHAPGPHAD